MVAVTEKIFVSHSVCGLVLIVLIPQGSTGRGGAPHHQWRRILWSCRDTFRVQIGRLLVHTLSPALPLCDRKEALEFVFDARHLDILKESLSPGLEVSLKEMHHQHLLETNMLHKSA